jgi:hypothetical protein
MNTDVEELLRDGMQRFTSGVTAPDGLAQAAGRLHRRRMAVRATAACGGIAVVAAAAVVAAGVVAGAAPATLSPAQQRHIAYVTSRVESALGNENLVYVGWTHGNDWGDIATYAYGSDEREVAYDSAGHPFWAQGTALVSGKLMSTYVTYVNKKYSLYHLGPLPTSACSTGDELALGGPPYPNAGWSEFIDATLRCGAASVTGNVRINGTETTQITGKPVTVRLSSGYSKAVKEDYATVRWTLYVNPLTYLPVRMYGSTQTYGGSAGNQISSAVTNVHWLSATAANVAQAMVTIPPGFQLYTGNPGNQISGTIPG